MTKRNVYIILILCASVLAGVLLVTRVMPAAFSEGVSRKGEVPEISVGQAKAAALSDAEVKSSEVTFKRRNLEYEGKKPYYRIEFEKVAGNDTDVYTYIVDGLNGSVERKDKRVKSFAYVPESPEDVKTGHPEENEKYIGVEKAKKHALSDTGLEHDDVTFTSVKLLNDSGRMIYQTQFESMGIKYDFDIDALTGKVLKREVEYNDQEATDE